MNWKQLCLAGTFATALLLTACNKDNNEEAGINTQDETFIVKASQSNRSEIELGTLALSKSGDDGVKMYAQMMVADHTAAQTELQNIVDNLDTNANMNEALDAEQAALRAMLESLSGASFDSAYIDGQIKGHVKTLGVFDAEIASGQNMQVKNFATGKRPVIEMHKNTADTIFLRVK